MAIAAYMARDGYYIASAQGDDAGAGTGLTEWDNAQAALIVTELKAMDWFIGASVIHTKPKTVNVNPMTSTHYPKRLVTGRTLGKIVSTHFLQTSVLSYYVMGASTAVAADATRAITKDTNEIPLWVAFHLEKEGSNTSRRKDIMGVVPNNLNVACSEQEPIARQTYTGEFSFTGTGGDLAQPTALVQATHPPFTWSHYRSASGTSAFTYNAGAAINVDIIGFNINFGWSGSTFGTYDANGYPNNGYYDPPFTTRVTLECKYKDHTGTDIQTISDLAPASYANGGDLTLIINFYEDATNYMEYTFTDMFVDPDSFEEVFQSEGDWFDGFRFDLVFKDETSTLALSSRDNLGDTYYTNP